MEKRGSCRQIVADPLGQFNAQYPGQTVDQLPELEFIFKKIS
jgi:hypothetical protein